MCNSLTTNIYKSELNVSLILTTANNKTTSRGLVQVLRCVSKKGPTLKRYSSKLYGSILMIFGGNIQKSLE